MMTKEQAINLLKNNPVRYARSLGFTKLGDLHNRWIREMVCGRQDKTLQASRGTYKTTSVSVALALIMLLLPNKRTLFMRKTDGDVKEVIRQVRKIILDPHTQALSMAIYGVPVWLTAQSATELSTNLTADIKGTAQLVGMGTGASLTGKHFDLVFTDDIVNLQDRISKAERDRTKLVYQELQNIKNRGGKIFNTGTPWHKDDCFSIMPAAEKYDCYHNEIRKIISAEKLEEIRQSMTASLFAANYELRHVAEDDVIFTSPQVGADIELAMNGNCHVDAAFYGEDYTAFTAMAIHDGRFYVFGKCWRKHIDDVMDEIVEWYNKLLCQKMFNELNADKGYVAKQLRNRGLKVSTYQESQNKYVKIVSYLKFEWPHVTFVRGTDDAYIQQICDYNENAEHDDCPDSLASLIRVMARKKQREYQSILGG